MSDLPPWARTGSAGSTGSADRRFGSRRRPEHLEWGWLGAVSDSDSVRKAKGRRRRDRQRCQVVDLSLSGALVLAPRERGLAVGQRVAVDVGGETNAAVIRRIERAVRGDALYGIVFVAPGPKLSEVAGQFSETGAR